MNWQFFPQNRFAEHAAAWDELQLRTTNTPFLESRFLIPALQEFGSGSELIAFRRRPNGLLDAATIVLPTGKLGLWENFHPSQLPLCPWIAAPADDLASSLNALLRQLPGFALGLDMRSLDPRLHQRPGARGDISTMDYIGTSFVDVHGAWDSYWEARGKNLRQNSRKQRNKLDAEGTPPHVQTYTRPEDVAMALQHYGALESVGWKGAEGTAIHPDNAQGRFYAQMLSNFCADGRGRLVSCRFGDKVVSMDLCIDNGPMVVILKTAYDESYRTVSPSSLMRQSEFEAWWSESQFKRIEFYGKTLEWHTRWTDQSRTLYHVTAYRWPVLLTLHERLRVWRNPVTAATEAPKPAPVEAASALPVS